MPLLNKKLFHRNGLPEDLRDDEEVFYCEATNEIFRDYEEFCERIILCNSLVWACSLSGKPNLTYQEALTSEENARSMLKDFPMELRIPVLYLTTCTERKSLNELAEDVYCYAKDRYFIGESVEVEVPGGPLTSCNVIRVIEPSEEGLRSLKKQTPKNGERIYWPPSSLYRYEVQTVSEINSKSLVVPADSIHRKKSVYSRAKNRLYIKQFAEQVDGYWRLKTTTTEKYRISKVKFDQIFVGDAPDLSSLKKSPSNTNKNNSGKKEKRQESIDKYFTKRSPSKQQNQQSDASQKTLLQKLKEKYKNQNGKNGHDAFRQKRKYTKGKLLQSSDKNSVLTEIEAKQRIQNEKQKIREQKRVKKEQAALLIKEYYRKREDLELEDLQDLPISLPVDLRFPNELFGEFAMALEFLHTFRETIKLKDYFPGGMTIDILERSLVDNEVQGPFCDILQMLLATIFELQEDEDDEIRDDSDLMKEELDVGDIAGDHKTKEAVRQATLAAHWAQAYQRTPLGQLTIDASTLSEVLRLHLLASGGRCGDNSAKWRYQQRGGYSSLDDPGLILRLTKPHILESLAQIHFCDLPIDDKLAVLSCLMQQILTFSAVRDVIDERMEKIKQGKVELRALYLNDKKREQEAHQKVKDGEWTIEQLEKEKELLHRRKQDQGRKAKELNEENMSNQVLPLGLDRAFRRYWVFSALPGLFIEHDEPFPGTCLPRGTPPLDLGLVQGEDPVTYIKRLFEQGSNKENLLKSPMKTPTKAQMTPSKSPAKRTPTKGTPSKKMVDVKASTRPLTCWADPMCPVHGTGEKVCWTFVKNEEDLNALIEKLNKRGIREHALQATLEEDRDKILQSISKCPVSRLNSNLCPTDETRKSVRNNPRYENANLDFPAGTPSEEILESILRDLILETEVKIHNGCLGSLKVADRSSWRDAIVNKTYDQQTEKLSWGSSNRQNGETNGETSADEEGRSRPSTPSSEISIQPLQLVAGVKLEQSSKLRELASAILQLEQSVDPKYLKRPLGRDKKETSEKTVRASQLAVERWETSLMASTSLSQLFLHFSTLDSSITWTRSVLKAKCRVCRRQGDPEKLLLCDGCNKGTHMYCLKPKLAHVPRGNWYCPHCKPRDKKPSPVKRRQVFTDQSDDEDEKENESVDNELPIGMCKVCQTKGPIISCESCSKGYHFDCISPPLRKVPTTWYCQSCRKGTIQNKKKEETSPPSDGERTSRRRSSKAATAKISQFAKQLRTNNWDGEGEPPPEPEGARRRSRRSLEAELAVARSANAASRDLPLDNATLQEVLDQVMHHEDAWPFLRPVTRADVEDYHKIIKHPMDFGTIKHKLNMLDYRTNGEVIADALLVFENCYAYNKEDTEIYQCGARLHALLEKVCHERGLDIEESAPPSKKSRTAV